MRHRVKGRKLGRTTPHRKATLRALSSALIREHRIETTLAKAKELRTFVEPLITRAKVDSTHNRRQVYSNLQDKVAVTQLFETVGPAAADRPGGYTRVLKLGFRVGDAAEMAVIELVDFNDVQPEGKDSKKKKTRRAGKAGKSEGTEDAPESKKGANKPAVTEAEAETDVEEKEATEIEETEAKVKDKSIDTAELQVKEETTSEVAAETDVEEVDTTSEIEANTAEPSAEKTENKKDSDEVVAKEEDQAANEDEEEEKK